MPTPQPDERSPIRAATAAVLSVVLIILMWNLTRVGGWALLFTPLLAVWVVTVFLGAPLNAPIQFHRLRG